MAERLFQVPDVEVPSASSVWGFFSESAAAATRMVESAANSDLASSVSEAAARAARTPCSAAAAALSASSFCMLTSLAITSRTKAGMSVVAPCDIRKPRVRAGERGGRCARADNRVYVRARAKYTCAGQQEGDCVERQGCSHTATAKAGKNGPGKAPH